MPRHAQMHAQDEAAAAQDALTEALAAADTLAAIFRAAEARLVIAATAAARGSRSLSITSLPVTDPSPK